MHSPHDVLNFWFNELTPKQWFEKDDALDAEIRDRFSQLHYRAALCELYEWRQTAKGRLAEIIVLDQFSRNIYRNQARAFACDPLALALAQEAVAQGIDKQFKPPQLGFMYLPYMHSESIRIHEIAMALYDQPGLERNFEIEIQHKEILERFGRYPHRNKALGRPSTAEEIAFLKQPGSSF
jgi:uncharacterized protein (DUF924 family)